MPIGKIVKSNGHTDYICQVFAPGEVEAPPSREEYAFGNFVQVELGGGARLVGLIYDTVLLNPDFGRLGPRLSPESELAIFSPDYLNEKATLVGIAAIGMIDAAGEAVQGVPAVAASTDRLVERMSEDEVRRFHEVSEGLQFSYAPLLLAGGRPLAQHLLQTVIERLTALFPEQGALFDLLHDDLAWKAQIGPMGGVG